MLIRLSRPTILDVLSSLILAGAGLAWSRHRKVPGGESISSSSIISLPNGLRKRGQRALLEARLYLVISILTGVGLIYFFTT
jgi:hypothetical protein